MKYSKNISAEFIQTNNMMDLVKYHSERKEVAFFMRRLYKKGLTTCLGGNISLKIDESLVAITPGGTDKGRMHASEICLMNLDGKNLTPNLKPSIETEMHLSIYRQSRLIKAVVHAHPPFTSSFAATGELPDLNLTAEAFVIIGNIQIAPYELMGSNKLAKIVSDLAKNSNALLLENHGVLTTGKNLLQAYDRIEVLEMAAKMNILVHILGVKKGLSTEQLQELTKFLEIQ